MKARDVVAGWPKGCSTSAWTEANGWFPWRLMWRPFSEMDENTYKELTARVADAKADDEYHRGQADMLDKWRKDPTRAKWVREAMAKMYGENKT